MIIKYQLELTNKKNIKFFTHTKKLQIKKVAEMASK